MDSASLEAQPLYSCASCARRKYFPHIAIALMILVITICVIHIVYTLKIYAVQGKVDRICNAILEGGC